MAARVVRSRFQWSRRRSAGEIITAGKQPNEYHIREPYHRLFDEPPRELDESAHRWKTEPPWLPIHRGHPKVRPGVDHAVSVEKWMSRKHLDGHSRELV